MNRLVFFFVLILNSFCFPAQSTGSYAYHHFEDLYDGYDKHDPQGLKYVTLHAKKARTENHTWELLNAYENGIYFSSGKEQKIKYADSAIQAALQSGKAEYISRAYLGKGIVYYFNYKKFQPALDQYLHAHHYSKLSGDPYLKNKILYHIGVVKCYLGYYDEALKYFENCLIFFESELMKEKHPTKRHNYRKGKLNTLHQIAVCFERMKEYSKADSIVNIGFETVKKDIVYRQELGYFLKSRGITNFRKGSYSAAIDDLSHSTKLLNEPLDFAWIAVNNFYIGKCYVKMNQAEKALPFFKKNDSSFNVNHFILPEILPQYEYLIDYYKNLGDTKAELYYTQQLLKADQYFTRDFKYLSTRLHKSYDIEALRHKQERLIRNYRINRKMVFLLSVGTVFLFIFLALQWRKSRHVTAQYNKLLEKIKTEQGRFEFPVALVPPEDKKIELSAKTIQDILDKLQIFEEKNLFTAQKLTLPKLAQQLKTNSSHLSYVLNQHKGMSFSTYLKHLRIHYITGLLYRNPKYRNYTIESLGNECGIVSRQTFSKQFYEINGILPKDFVRKLRKEKKDDHDL